MTPPTREEQARRAVRQVKGKLDWLFSKEGSRDFYSTHLEAAGVDLLVDLARDGDREALDILRKHARGWHQDALNDKASEVKVPNSLLQLLFEIFIYGLPKAKRGTGPKDTALRYQAITVLVRFVSENFGFPEYTQPQDRDNPDAPLTSSRIVGEEFGLSPRWIEEISASRKRPTSPPN
jgi:hypothetical protein